ncbi:MAG: phosphate ABC transporter substrate-binding protein PstS, partial [Bdellovibrionia bacterium]
MQSANSYITNRFFKVFSVLVLLGTWSATAGAVTLINGAGATFPFPLYSKWFFEYEKENPNVHINYQSIGSGGGIRLFLEKTMDFGASDAPMTVEQLSKADRPVLHIPTVVGAVVLVYNLPGISQGLKLNSNVIVDIFLGKIDNWNDKRIKEMNPQFSLPDLPIIVARRSDGSGTTHVFTDYLSKTSPDWKKQVGTGPAVNWPIGLGGKGNEGVAGLIKQSPGSIGYVELIYAKNNELPYAAIKNQSGYFILPDLTSVTAASASFLKSIPADFRISITDSPGVGAYPICALTYLLV